MAIMCHARRLRSRTDGRRGEQLFAPAPRSGAIAAREDWSALQAQGLRDVVGCKRILRSITNSQDHDGLAVDRKDDAVGGTASARQAAGRRAAFSGPL